MRKCGVSALPRTRKWAAWTHLGHDGRGDLPREESLEVEAGEPLVRLDVLRSALDTAVALGEVCDEKFLDEALGVLVHEPREGELPREDQLVDLFFGTFNNRESRNNAPRKGWEIKISRGSSLAAPFTHTTTGRSLASFSS